MAALTTWQMRDGILVVPISVLEDREAAAQILKNALLIDLGEYDLEPDAGIDPGIMRVKNPQIPLMRAELRRVLERFPWVAEAEDIKIEIDRSERKSHIDAVVRTDFGLVEIGAEEELS